MSDETSVTLKVEGLQKLVKAFKGNLPMARVGILGASSERTPEPKAPAEISHSSLMRRAVDTKNSSVKKAIPWTNAQIGARWEFDPKWKRSFLRVPIMDRLHTRLSAAGAFKDVVIEDVIRTGDLTPYIAKIGHMGVDISLGAFQSCGYGKWVPSVMRYKKNQQTLVETKQLMRAISTDVK